MPSKLFPLQPIFTPILSRVFPQKLKIQSFGPLVLQRRQLLNLAPVKNPALLSMRKFSTRQKMGSGQNMRAGASKSLIEDEADLSDWVSGLSSNSLKKTKMYSDSDNGEGENGGFRGGERGGKRRRGEGELGEDSDFTRRRGGGNRGSSDFGGPSRRGGGSRGSSDFEGRRGGGNRGSSDFESRRGGGNRGSSDFESRRGGGSRGSSSFEGRRGGGTRGSGEFESSSRGRNSSGTFLGRRNNESDNDSYGGSFNGRGRGRGRGGGRGSSDFGRGGKFGNQMEGRKTNNDSVFSRGDEGRKEKKWGERGLETRNTNGRGRGGDRGGLGMKRGGKGMSQRGPIVTDEEDEEEEDDEVQEKGYVGFKELIDSDEVDEEDDDDEEEEEEDEDEGEEEKSHGLLENGSGIPQSTQSSLGQNDSYLSESRFDQCSVSPLSLKGIKDAGYEKMTLVQEATLPHILKGKDVLAKAKTGTGKTVAFLLPAIELVVKSTPVAHGQQRPPILVLVICPTRELASQAAAEANKLLKYHPSIGVQVVIGGTRLTLEQKRMQANPCQILVATPGRLRDHVENTAGFATRLMGVKVLILDEADHLLDMGFRKDIERIIAAVPKQRQTLLFSATIPPEVRQICHIALKKDHEYINTVQEGSEDTHSQVRQTHLVAPLDKHFPLLYALLKEHIADDVNYKILVFCTTAMVTHLVAELLGELKMNVREIHSRKPQSYRTRISDEFRKSKGLILVTSDVSARGVDYPDVTLVIQIGVPSDKQQYIHRLGRTGRKGKEGQGILMLAPWEEFFLSNIKDLPISKAPEPMVDPDTRKKVEHALTRVEMKSKESAYQAWLGYYNSTKNVGRDKCRLVELANEFSRTMGLDNPPAIPKLVLGKMGLKNVPGLRSK